MERAYGLIVIQLQAVELRGRNEGLIGPDNYCGRTKVLRPVILFMEGSGRCRLDRYVTMLSDCRLL